MNREVRRNVPTIDSVEVLGYQIKENLTQHLLQYVSFISLSLKGGHSLINNYKKPQPNITNIITHMLSFCLGQSY